MINEKYLKIKRAFLLVAAIFVLSACGSSSTDSISNLNIFNGTKVKEGEWLSAVAITEKGNEDFICTGTVVHPKLVITARHCIKSNKQYGIYVGNGSEGGKVSSQYFSSKTGILENNEGFRDIAYIVTEKEIDIDPEHIIPILYKEDEIKTIIAPNAYSHIVGFGSYKEKETGKTGEGIKYEAETTIDENDPIASKGNEVKIAGNDKITGSCFGDSGGPAYGKTENGEWKVYGVVSGGTTPECGLGSSIFGLMHKSICEIEEQSEIDLDVGEYCDKN